jgi:hypothetical protein
MFTQDPFLAQYFGGVLDPRAWFKHAFHPKVGKRMAFIGFARPTQGMLPACSELQARYFALLCSNRRRLPDDLERVTLEENAAEAEMLKGDANLKTLVQYPYFSESMAELIGCKPRLRTQLTDPLLAYKLFFGSKLSYRFRLDGPHGRPNLSKRVLKRLRVADTVKGQAKVGLLNIRPVYEASAVLSELVNRIRKSNQSDLGFHAWDPGQLRQGQTKPESS